MPIDAATLTHDIEVKINGTALPHTVALESIDVTCALSGPSSFCIRLLDPFHDVTQQLHLELGSDVHIALTEVGSRSSKKLLSGTVVSMETEGDQERTLTSLKGFTKLHSLRHRHTVASYVNASFSDVVRQVAGRSGLAVGKVDSTSPVFPQLWQEGIDDWSFLQRLAGELGYLVNDFDGKLNFVKPPASSGTPARTVEFGVDLLWFRSLASNSGQLAKFEVKGWDEKEKKAIVGTAQRKAEMFGNGVSEAQSHHSGTSGLFYELGLRDSTRASKIAEGLASSCGNAGAEFEAMTLGDPNIKPGDVVELKNTRKPFDGKYVVTSVRHQAGAGLGYTTTMTFAGTGDISVASLTGGLNPQRWRVPGVVPAIITDNKDPDKRGRVKVKFPWLDEKLASDWARVAVPMAGKDRGFNWLPEVNDEVLVAFEFGDVNLPYVVGAVHNGIDKPPYQEGDVDGGGKVKRRAIVSTTKHILEVHDEGNKIDGFRLATGDGKYELVLDRKNTTVTINSDGTITIKGTKGITIDAEQSDITVKGNNVKIDAQGSFTVDAKQDASISATNNAKLAGTTKAEVSGTQVEVKANGELKLDGALEAQLHGATVSVKGDAMAEVQAAMVKIN